MGVPKGQASELERRGGHGESSDWLIASKTLTPRTPPPTKSRAVVAWGSGGVGWGLTGCTGAQGNFGNEKRSVS